MMIDTDRNT